MDLLIRYISIILLTCCVSSCSKDESLISRDGEDCVEFVIAPTSFFTCDVSSVSTKTNTKAVEGTILENKIVSLYFMVYDSKGNRRVCQKLGNSVTSKLFYHTCNAENPITVCFLANVSEEYVESLTHIGRLSDTPLTLNYSSPGNTGPVGVPLLGEEQCFPMFGMVEYNGSTVENNKVQIQMERLLAKVVLRLKTDFDSELTDILDMPDFTINKITVTNLPKQVCITSNNSSESSWVSASSNQYFENAIEIDIDDMTIGKSLLLDEFTEIFTCYVPEYFLESIEGSSNNKDQRKKPNMYDPLKRPVYITIHGISKQTNFVDVPLTYNIFLGENAVNDFNLYKNTLYNNNITLKGTGDAILGEDDRTEATYHNLADPTNSGTDDPANCYIISKPGRYLIPTYIGNDIAGLTKSGTSADYVDINGSANNRISNINLKQINGKNFIQFDVNMYDASGNFSLTDVAGGNKLLRLKDASGTIWSWHLWFCLDTKRPDNDGKLHKNEKNSLVMNRALGAIHPAIDLENSSISTVSLSYWDDGLYYQWGRKDPFNPSGNSYDDKEVEQLYNKSVKNPTLYYSNWNIALNKGWSGDNKTVDDPCPPGYQVAKKEIWKSSPPSSDGLETIMNLVGLTDGYPYNLEMTTDIQVNIVYPYSSFLNNRGFIPDKDDIPLQDANGGRLYSKSRHLGRYFGTDYYVRVGYSGTKSTIDLKIWAKDGALYHYSEDFYISDDYVLQYSTDDKNWKEIGSTIKRILDRLGLSSVVSGILGNLKEPKTDYLFPTLSDEQIREAAHVRCQRIVKTS